MATGFIYGCSRQLDIVIYDRIDYAPVFREGDLVVVPPASVRAAIEVKTNLNKQEIKDSILLLQNVCLLDDKAPPFFKGIFGFQSELEKKKILEEVLACYWYEPNGVGDMEEHIIVSRPHDHITCLCVLDSAFGTVFYDKDEITGNYIPVLYGY